MTTPATVGAQPGFTTYSLSSSVTITSGDFIVGYQIAPENPNAIALDNNNPMSRSYVSGNGTNFAIYNSNFMIRAAQVFIGCSAGAPTASTIVSRKLHGGTPYDIPLPLTGSSGIECRSGGASNDYQIVFSFPNSVTFTNASVTAGAGSVSGSSGSGTSTVIVNLTGVTNAQRLTVTLLGASDGTNTGDLSVPMGVLLGDTSGNGSVNASDVSQTKLQSGQVVTATNFREDVTVNGSINASDVSLVKADSGTALP